MLHLKTRGGENACVIWAFGNCFHFYGRGPGQVTTSKNRTTILQSILFDYLINIWEFNPSPVSKTCNLYFLIAFMFFKEVASRMIGSFTERCYLIYELELRVHERSYEERA
ncbi:hypothetical protein HN51_046917 [Arachis hypogaea]